MQVQPCGKCLGKTHVRLTVHAFRWSTGDKDALWAADSRTLGMQSGTEETRLSFDFVAGHSRSQEQLFRGDPLPGAPCCKGGP